MTDTGPGFPETKGPAREGLRPRAGPPRKGKERCLMQPPAPLLICITRLRTVKKGYPCLYPVRATEQQFPSVRIKRPLSSPPPPPPPRKTLVKSTVYNEPHRRERALRLLLVLACIVLLGILTLGRPGSAAAQGTPQGSLEFPASNSAQSGIGFISGWVCTATNVEIEINGISLGNAASGGQRADTQSICGDTDNGFAMPFNWNRLGDGEHTVVAWVDGVELGRAVVTVTTVGEEFLRDVVGECVVEDFPMVGQTVRLEWQQNIQNFVITSGTRPAGENRARVAGVGYLENPGTHSFQSGIGFIAGWVCTATNVEIEINGISLGNAAYGGQRADTQSICGDTDNGFAMPFNWNRLGGGEHTVVTLVDGEELGRAVVTVTTVGEEFLRDAEGECVVEDFPLPGETVRLEWQQNIQNFVITNTSTSIGGPCLQTSASVAGRGFGLAKDCATLLGLKDTLSGTASLNWADTLNMDSWDGITVSGTPARVTELSLAGYQLTGTIPAELGDLSNLTHLNLSDNALTGTIPSALGSLSNLTHLDLRSAAELGSDNALTGSIPATLGNLSNLEYLDLSDNALTGSIPSALGNLSNLEYLALDYNKLTGSIPSALGNLSNLTHLDLSSASFPSFSNQLTGSIPAALGNLSNLEYLDLSGNQLTGTIPAALGNLSNLEYLNLNGARQELSNQLTGSIPAALSNLSNLVELDLSSNALTGLIPAVLSNLSNLERLSLSGNQLTGTIPAELGDLSNLKYLNLHGNQLTGAIPTALGNLSRLEILALSWNGLTGAIPTALGNLSNLEQLSLYSNQLTGAIPTTLGDLTNLTHLNLSNNQLTGAIPTALGNLTNLMDLDLSRNQLTGTITTLGTLTNLRSLHLYGNQLTGTIPTTLGTLTNLRSLRLYGNQLTGTIPTTLGTLTNLTELNLGGNQLTGTIPSELGDLSNLTYLYLYGNQLTGPITTLGTLTNLRYLSLFDNQLTGTIPVALGNLTNLESLLLGGNQLTGSIPAALGDLTNLESLDLGNNQLTGSIPAALGDLTNLTYLYLADNQLTGSIPSELGDLSNLTYLYLADNQLTGAIPVALGNLSNLSVLTLSDNQLTGTIPVELGDLSRLSWLDLGGNQLTGSIPVALGNLSNLRDLNLGGNQLEGTIPAALGNLHNLERLYLFNNQLEGTLPSALRRVKVLRLGGNLSTFGLPLSITITTTADTLTPEFATFEAETDPCGTVVDLAQFPAEPTLREALIYANDPSVSKPITITFAPSLDNQTIILTDSLPSLCGGDITLDGDVYAYGSPSITLDSAGVPADLEVLTIRSADNTITGFYLTNVPDSGILVWHTASFGETVTNNEITDNTITNGNYGIVVQAGSATEAGMLSKTTVSGNTISETIEAGIGVFAMYAGSTITDTAIEMNEVFENTESGIVASSVAANTTLVDSITKLTIRDNIVQDHAFGSGISIVSGFCNGSYNRMQAEITNNTLDRNGQENPLFPAIAAGGGTVPLSCSSGVTATHNHLDVTITDNSVEDTDSIGISVYGGYQNSDHNTVTARVERNAVWRSTLAGISLTGGTTDSNSNTVTATLNDNLIARATEPDFGTAGHGLALVAASAIPSTSTSSNNTVTVSGRGNAVALKRNASDSMYDLFRQEGNDTTAGRTGNTLTDDALTGTSFASQGGDAFDVKPKPEPPAPVTIPDTHPEVTDFTVTPVSEEERPSTTQFTTGNTVFDVTVEDEDGEPVEGPLTEPVQVCLPIPQGVSASQAYLFRYNEVTNTWSRQTTGRVIRDGFVCVDVSEFSLFTVGSYRRSTTTGGTTPTGGGGGGGGSRDQHGNTPAQATPVSLGTVAPWMASTAGQINSASDIDYFQITVPHAGTLVVETTGRTDTMGTVWQDGEQLATADSGGERRNFLLSAQVEAGPVVVAVEGRRTGAYSLETHLLVGFLENPGTGSFQSGISVLSGWLCDADIVEIVLDDRPPQVAAYGTDRLDTEEICGDSDNGFGLLFNWNRLEDGEHTARALADGVEFGRATFTVTTLGEEFVRGVEGETLVQDFPSPGKAVRLVWQQGLQNFMLAPLDGSPAESPAGPDDGPMGVLENPGPRSWQSGIGVLSGWVCEADMVEVVLDDRPVQLAAYGTERADTEAVCGDTDNGFGLLFNWNRLEDGVHTVRALADGEEFGRATFTVTTLGTEFLRGAEGETVVPDFPSPGEAVRLRWQGSNQNFVITNWE